MLTALAKGLAMTFRHLFRPRVTLQYPEVKKKMYPRFRGRVQMPADPETGKELCIACNRCATGCPAGAIKIEGAKREDGSRYPARFTLDLTRCIFCGFCVEACPKNALKMSHAYELAEGDKSKLILSKEELMKSPDKENE